MGYIGNAVRSAVLASLITGSSLGGNVSFGSGGYIGSKAESAYVTPVGSEQNYGGLNGLKTDQSPSVQSSQSQNAPSPYSTTAAKVDAFLPSAAKAESKSESRSSSVFDSVSSDYSGLSSGKNVDDYSGYMRSLDNYCRECGFIMPEICNNDYHSAYSAWNSVYSQWSSEHVQPKQQAMADADIYYDIIPTSFADGSVIFHDLNGHGSVSAMKQANGFYNLSGPKSLITAIGGRGEFDTIIRHLSDGNYFNDGKS